MAPDGYIPGPPIVIPPRAVPDSPQALIEDLVRAGMANATQRGDAVNGIPYGAAFLQFGWCLVPWRNRHLHKVAPGLDREPTEFELHYARLRTTMELTRVPVIWGGREFRVAWV